MLQENVFAVKVLPECTYLITHSSSHAQAARGHDRRQKEGSDADQ